MEEEVQAREETQVVVNSRPDSQIKCTPEGVTLRKECEDSTREIRSMTLATLPCPPLPIMGTHECSDESNCSDEYAVANSHDLIGHLLNIRAAASQDKVNRRREREQMKIHQELLDRIDEMAENPGVELEAETIYAHFCDFTRKHVAALLDGSTSRSETMKIPDLRIHALASVHSGDAIHRAAVDFARAQDLIFGVMGSADKSSMSYRQLILLSAQRIIFAPGS